MCPGNYVILNYSKFTNVPSRLITSYCFHSVVGQGEANG